MQKKKIFTGLSTVFATLLALVAGGTSIAYQYEGAINTFLDVQLTEIVQKDDGGEAVDTEYFKSDFGARNEANAKKTC
ncbi:MAG TPA: hypothetical protein IAB69_04285 [Candidatus Coproplasma excrementigallinarum]|uniref:Uncharacterized protein n=1 Tax=Candidatus Coproplasma excrementigallinarum TaxID=2840747 RepID=A0A9D1MKA8_9FIRM|nr:hypothetical protein [Candidatus Coproplasma excrementigallinarum]